MKIFKKFGGIVRECFQNDCCQVSSFLVYRKVERIGYSRERERVTWDREMIHCCEVFMLVSISRINNGNA